MIKTKVIYFSDSIELQIKLEELQDTKVLSIVPNTYIIYEQNDYSGQRETQKLESLLVIYE